MVERRGVLPQHVTNRKHALGERHVRELRGVDEVADGPDSWCACATSLVDLDETSVVDAYTRTFEAEKIRERTAADGDHDDLDIDGVALSEGHGGVTSGRIGSVALHHHSRTDVDAPLLERPFHDLGRVFITAHKDLR